MAEQKEIFLSKPYSNVFDYGLAVLNTHSSDIKAELTLEALDRYKKGEISMGDPSTVALPPLIAARPDNVETLPPSKMPRRRKGGNLKNRIAMLHSFCHIESYAIDLSWDVLVRFAANHWINNKHRSLVDELDTILSCFKDGNFTKLESENESIYVGNRGVKLPLEFYEDWLRIAAEEAVHYSMWRDRLIDLGSHYGALPGHNGLWQSAQETSDDILARLGIVHMVLEGRGLDVEPSSMAKLKGANDNKSAEMLAYIAADEITHVASGVRWFKYICENVSPPIDDPKTTFQNIVRERFAGALKPPFNKAARDKANFDEDWYLPLAHKNKIKK